jgi:A/G-specific adenine glycosylase
MLQQTQVATVIPYFNRFLKRFPTFADLAAADEQEVLRLWQGLGYYSRARNLQAAARYITRDCQGVLPCEPEVLLTLPGIGRYTAGAVASMAFEKRAPILDGNVTRVLCRLDRIEADPREPAMRERLWERAEEILPKERVGDFNSALMELGATVCTPRNPQCLICPAAAHCQALAAGVQEKIPPPKRAKPTPLLHRQTYCIHHDGRWLIEQRPATGRWAGMWQFITVEPPENGASPILPISIHRPRKLGIVRHALTHRRYQFDGFLARARAPKPLPADPPRRWVTIRELNEFPLPRPHLKIVQMLQSEQPT